MKSSGDHLSQSKTDISAARNDRAESGVSRSDAEAMTLVHYPDETPLFSP